MTDAFSAVLMEPVKYKSGVAAGFIVFPRSQEVPTGWGEPYETADGTPIWPGTAGGPNPNRLVGYLTDDSAWKMKRSKIYQVAGAIDWWGPWINTKTKKKRYVVSCNGPVSRYWNPAGAFVYGSSETHQEVYMNGRLLSVAPFPVLGAALCTWNKPNENGQGTTKETLLVVICKNGTYDEMYCRKRGSLTLYEEVTEELRIAMSALKSDNTPDGWEKIATSLADTGSYPPETPWFWNELGTAARTIRRRTETFTNEEGESKTQDQHVELGFTFNPTNKTGSFVSYINQVSQIQYSETVSKTHPTWTDMVADQWGLYHDWQEDWLEWEGTQTGRIKVAVDWSNDLNAWVYGWFDVDDRRRANQYWTVGIDPMGMQHTNYGSHAGTAYPPSDPYVPQIRDHTESQWLGIDERRSLLIGRTATNPLLKFVVGYGQSGTKSAYDGLPDGEDTAFYYWESFDVHIHHADLRSMLIVGLIRFDQMLVNDVTAGLTYHYEENEMGSVESEWSFTEADFFSSYTAEIEEWDWPWIGFDRATMEDWPEAYEEAWSVSDYQGEWGTANDNEDIFSPDIKDYYLSALFHPTGPTPDGTTIENPQFRRRTLNDIFLHPDRCYREGQFSSAENNSQLVTFEFQNRATREMEVATRLYPVDDDLSNLTKGGTKFNGGGTI